MDTQLDAKNPNSSPSNSYQVGDGNQSYTHSGGRENVIMDKWHFIHTIDVLRVGSRKQTFSDVWPWVITGVAFLLTLGTTQEYKRVLGIEPAAWQALNLGAMVVSFVVAAVVSVRALCSLKERSKTSEQIFDEVCDSIEENNQRVLRLKQKSMSDKGDSRP